MQIIDLPLELLTDRNIVFFLQFIILLLFIYALFKDFLSRNSGRKVKRGKIASKIFSNFVFISISLVLFAIITLMEWGKEYKVGLFIINSLIIIYLGFYNAWFKNKLVGIIIKFEERWESP